MLLAVCINLILYHLYQHHNIPGIMVLIFLGDRLQNGSPYAIRLLSVCLSCLSVTLVYCGQTVGWIKMKPGTQVGLGPGHIVLDGDPATLPKKGAEPQIFGPCLLWPNGWMDQDGTWHGGGPRSKPHGARWGPSYRPKKAAEPPPLIFGPFILWPNG